MYTAKVVLIAAVGLCVSCTSQSRYQSLVKTLNSRKPDCVITVTGSLDPRDNSDSPECIAERAHWQERVEDARRDVEEAELKAMPACAQEWVMSDGAYKEANVDRSRPFAQAELLRSGFTAYQYVGTPCAKQVCKWLTLQARASPFCPQE